MSDPIREANWQVHWNVTESAGVKLYLADYKGKRVLWEASLPYVLTDHHKNSIEPEEEGTALEPHGPWWAPLGTRTLVGDVRRTQFRGGFELAADFQAGLHRFTQLWRFHADGRFAPWLVLHGHGLHPLHTYHPHWRFDFDVNGATDDALEYWTEGRWHRVAEEGWLPFTGQAAPDGNVWRQVDLASDATVSVRPQKWEDAELFAIRYHAGEWPPFSPRGAANDQPFPAAYVGAEPIDGEDVTLWYVAHVHYEASFPFTAGPWVRVSGV